jgi:hypothetical protein
VKAAIVLALSLSYAAPAFSQPANKAAIVEAKHFLVPCDRVAASDREFCTQNHANFLEDYVHAMAGNPDFIEELTHYFGTWATTDPRPWRPGIRSDRQEGCAWMLVQAAFTPSPEGRDNLATQIYLACIDFTAQARLAIWLRATDLVVRIRTHPTTPPPEEPYVPSNGGNLITTVPDDDKPSAPENPYLAPKDGSLITAMPNPH